MFEPRHLRARMWVLAACALSACLITFAPAGFTSAGTRLPAAAADLSLPRLPQHHAALFTAARPFHHPHVAVVTAEAVFPQHYTVRAGDTLTVISQRAYGRADAWTVIYRANRHLVTDPSVLLQGWHLTIPKLPRHIPPPPVIKQPVLVAHHQHSNAGSAPAVPAAPAGSPEQIAWQVFGSQEPCAGSIIVRESGWNIHASNPSSGAYGIPQALPGSKMASAGPDWQDNALTQLRWMKAYVDGSYGGACAAWAFWQNHGWY